MRRSIAIFLLGTMLCASTEAYQLLKLPLLVVHYLEHKTEDPAMDMAAFWAMHYAEETVYDEDWQDDMQLPFKQCTCLQLHVQPVVQADYIQLTHPIAVEVPNTYIPVLPHMNGVDSKVKIFQPPRSYA